MFTGALLRYKDGVVVMGIEATKAIVELAECVKELCRLLEDVTPREYPRGIFKARLDAVYKKATRAKDRV